eukprot:6269293-Amphidinium_carterae.2
MAMGFLMKSLPAGRLWDSSGNTGQRSSARRSRGLLKLLSSTSFRTTRGTRTTEARPREVAVGARQGAAQGGYSGSRKYGSQRSRRLN